MSKKAKVIIAIVVVALIPAGLCLYCHCTGKKLSSLCPCKCCKKK